MKSDLFDITGKKIGEVELKDEIFGQKPNVSLVAQAVRVFLANQRQGTAMTKTRGEVAGSSKKIYRQKGTGRARQGSIRAPHRRKGGIVFGPRIRNFALKLTRQMKKQALFSALSSSLLNHQISFVDNMSLLSGKTKDTYSMLKNFNASDNSTLVVLTRDLSKISRSFRNIPGVRVTRHELLTTYEVIKAQKLIFTKEALQAFQSK